MMIFLVAFYESLFDDSLYLLQKRALSLFIASIAKLIDFFFGFCSG
jgi:hypothetical protein